MWKSRWGNDWEDIPPPCPVDDAPFHTCVSPDYVSGRYGGPVDPRVQIAQRLTLMLPAPTPDPPTTGPEINVSTYRGDPRTPRPRKV